MKRILSILLINIIFCTSSLSGNFKSKRTGKIKKFSEIINRNLQQQEHLLTHDEEPTSGPNLDPDSMIPPGDYPTQVIHENLPLLPKSVGNRLSSFSILIIANVIQQLDQKRLQFDIFLRISSRNPPKIISFFVRLFYLFRINLRDLEEKGYYRNAPVKCHFMGSSSTNEGIVSYECVAQTDDKKIENAEINSELPMKHDGKMIPLSELTFSPEAAETSKNMTNNAPIIDKSKGMPNFYELNNGKVIINSTKFIIINGTIENFKNNVGDSFKFKFPNKNEGGSFVETNCIVSKKNGSYVEFDCGIVNNLETESIHLSSGILGNKTIFLNMLEGKDKISIQGTSSQYLDPMASIDLADLSTEKVQNSKPIEKSIANRNAEVFILRISKSTKTSDTKLKFNIFLKFSKNPPKKIAFWIRILYIGGKLIYLKEYYKNSPTQCDLKGNQNSNGVLPYECHADTENNPIENVEINTDLPIKTENGEINNSKVTFSPEAEKTSKKINNGPDINLYSTFYELMDGKVTTSNNKFILIGNIKDFQNKVGDVFKFYFNNKPYLYDKRNDPKHTELIETNCKVSKIASSTVKFECWPVDNLYAESIHLSSGSSGNSNVVFNMIDGQDKVEIYTDPSIKGNSANFRKNSSGLSGGPIAAIVILSIMALIIGSGVVALMFRKSGQVENNGPNIVGLKTVDY